MDEERQDAMELSDIEKSAIGEICDLMTASLAQLFGTAIGENVDMNPAVVEMREFAEISGIIAAPVLLIQLNCTSGLNGQFFLFIAGEGLPSVFDIGIPENAKDTGADDEVILETLKDMVNDTISGAMASFAESMGQRIECSVVDTVILQDEAGFDTLSFLYPDGKVLHVASELGLPGGPVNTGYLMPASLSGQIIDLLLSEQLPSVTEGYSSIGLNETDLEELGQSDDKDYAGLSDLPSMPEREPVPQVHDLQSATFGALNQDRVVSDMPSNISLLLDVMLDAAIELGKTQMTIEEILKLGRGSVIELDKLASEPVEFLVNGKVIARGEVVVIDDNFGIRITEILSPKARLENI